MRALFHSPSRDQRGRLSLGVDLDYGRGRDPMTVRIDVPREFEKHARSWLSQFVGMAETGKILPARAALPRTKFSGYGADCGCNSPSYGSALPMRNLLAPLANTVIPMLPSNLGSQAGRAMTAPASSPFAQLQDAASRAAGSLTAPQKIQIARELRTKAALLDMTRPKEGRKLRARAAKLEAQAASELRRAGRDPLTSIRRVASEVTRTRTSPTRDAAKAKQIAKQASRSLREIRRGTPVGQKKAEAIAKGVQLGDPQAIQAAEKLEAANKASQIAKGIQAGNMQAIQARENLRPLEDTNPQAAEAAAMIDECLAMQAARLLAEANMYDSPEEALIAMQSFGAEDDADYADGVWDDMAADLESYQWDSPFDAPEYSDLDLSVAAINDAGGDFGAALGYDASQRAHVEAIDRTLSKARNAQLNAWAYRG